MRLGFYGGTFDPPHCGHLAVARAAVAAYALDLLWLTPTGRQPLKAADPVAPYRDRLAMVKLLCEGEPGLEASSLEEPLEDGSANFTIDTLRRVREQINHDDELLVVVGADAFLGLRRWREPDELLAIAEWVVVSRPGFALSDLSALGLSVGQRSRVHLLEDVHVPVSATELRSTLMAGDDASELVPERVWDYIRTHDLYRRDRA